MHYRKSQAGALNPFLIPLILLVVMAIGMSIFAFSSYGKYSDLRDNFDQKVSEGVEASKAQYEAEINTQFEEKEKNPFSTYESPSSLGSITFDFPKTWSGYVELDEAGSTSSSLPMDGYFHPDIVPAKDGGTAFALRVQVEDVPYNEAIEEYSRDVEEGTLKASSIKIGNNQGVRYDGVIVDERVGAMVVFKVRNQTLRLWTESDKFIPDFENIILTSLSFVL